MDDSLMKQMEIGFLYNPELDYVKEKSVSR